MRKSIILKWMVTLLEKKFYLVEWLLVTQSDIFTNILYYVCFQVCATRREGGVIEFIFKNIGAYNS